MSDKKDRVMVDIETLGTEPGAAIVSIAAATFGNGEHETFYRSINIQSATDAGLNISGDTLEWWLEKDPEIQQSELMGGGNVRKALADFNGFVATAEELWANSPSFDLAILKEAMQTVGIEPDWGFYQERDYRTLKNLPGRPYVERDGDKHHALGDAIHQAKVAEKMLETYEKNITERVNP